MAAPSPTLTRPIASAGLARAARWLGPIGLLAGVYIACLLFPSLTDTFPAQWNLGMREAVDDFSRWVTSNRLSHPAFAYFFDPLSAALDAFVRAVENALLGAHWAVIIGVTALAGWLLGGWRLALVGALGFFACGLMGLWPQTMQTLALMNVSVFIALLIGIPLGVVCALSNRFDRFLRPILDAMQVMPAFVYLIPVVLFFGVARAPAIVATVIYAIPPAVRLTNLGIREVQPAAVEAARAFGSTRWQILRKVQLPLALPAIMAGVNQTIMMALGIVVIAAMVGAGGLGREVYLALQRLQVGRAFEAGLAIVLIAIILDRLSEGLSRIDLTQYSIRKTQDAGRKAQNVKRNPASYVLRHSSLIGALAIILVTALCVLAFQDAFPDAWRLPLREPVDGLVRWMRDNLFFITRPLSDFITLYLLNPFRDLLRDVIPWPVVIAAVAVVAYLVSGWRLALGCALGMFMLGLLGMWPQSMDTLSQVLVTTAITVLLALPVGILASQSDGVRRALRPVLDFLQTVPTFVFLVPVVMLFNIGRVPGIIASVLYAIPVGIRLVDLGIRQVSPEAVEAATAFGSTRAQTIVKVQLPLAKPAIVLSINQMIMMVLAMVVIAGMVGGAGLGLEAVIGLTRSETGIGISAGLCIVVLAMILDRITQAWAARQS
ncbi:MAG: ABC transporter permease subunit [Anaerolineae bacterium]|nr:ABC transporter permease subunit [Candidatus Roseilinea sp.]MDW8450213.1 ABC transporter permease subunit [Anaerolineae bacterium]